MAILQRMKHTADDICAVEDATIVHVVNTVTNGGEYTMCGRAIPDSSYDDEGFEAVGDEYVGSLCECSCSSCMKIIKYIKGLW